MSSKNALKKQRGASHLINAILRMKSGVLVVIFQTCNFCEGWLRHKSRVICYFFEVHKTLNPIVKSNRDLIAQLYILEMGTVVKLRFFSHFSSTGKFYLTFSIHKKTLYLEPFV